MQTASFRPSTSRLGENRYPVCDIPNSVKMGSNRPFTVFPESADLVNIAQKSKPSFTVLLIRTRAMVKSGVWAIDQAAT
jgi:hypothetical protein